MRARAVENQCYVVACGQGGRHDNGRQTFGHSMIIDPWGVVQAVHETGLHHWQMGGNFYPFDLSGRRPDAYVLRLLPS